MCPRETPCRVQCGSSPTRVSSSSSSLKGHDVFLHFGIAKVKTRFTREPLVTTVSLVNHTVACVPAKHRAAFNLRSYVYESVFILLFTESHNEVLHFDITQVKKRFSRDALVTNASFENLTLTCVPERHRAAFQFMVLPPRECLHHPPH